MKSSIDISILISNELKKLREKTGLTTKEFSEIIKKIHSNCIDMKKASIALI